MYYSYRATAMRCWVNNYKWMSEGAILAAENKDVDDVNFVIQNEIVGTLHSFKSIDCVTNEDKRSHQLSI